MGQAVAQAVSLGVNLVANLGVEVRPIANAMRSALNTAKPIEENRSLMRLKELEARPHFGGLDGLLNQLVTLK